ncbi:hypothetical protein SELMODRAFT_421016 [Selaginella moellendorffii]|uniref:Uncharacterized protein n=1 Tax=Selaginella moellendorffii TaxID=88036 RepID=D8SDV6_SELML|nr:hypothetical protein SELMODRAFT_421016 [Selaginella moellendorffii]
MDANVISWNRHVVLKNKHFTVKFPKFPVSNGSLPLVGSSSYLQYCLQYYLQYRALELNTTATQGVLTDSAQKKDGMTATGPDGEIHESTDSDQDFWLPEMTEYANTDDFVAPVPAVQYFLLLLAAKKPERLHEIFAYEKNIADKLLTVPESEAVGENK